MMECTILDQRALEAASSGNEPPIFCDEGFLQFVRGIGKFGNTFGKSLRKESTEIWNNGNKVIGI